MKYTKQQKHEIYKKVLIVLQSNENAWCCPEIYKICNIHYGNLGNIDLINKIKFIFNELYEQKTKSGILWFNDANERIDALKKCIEMTK